MGSCCCGFISNDIGFAAPLSARDSDRQLLSAGSRDEALAESSPLLSLDATSMLDNSVVLDVKFDAIAALCHKHDDAAPCCVAARGTYTGPRLLTSPGVHRARVRCCRVHNTVWTPLAETHVSTGSCTGDILQGCIVAGSYWPRAFRLWQTQMTWLCWSEI